MSVLIANAALPPRCVGIGLGGVAYVSCSCECMVFSSCGAPVNAAGLRHEYHWCSTRVSAKCGSASGCCRAYHWPCDVAHATPYCALAVRFVFHPSVLVLLGCLLAPIACAQCVCVCVRLYMERAHRKCAIPFRAPFMSFAHHMSMIAR